MSDEVFEEVGARLRSASRKLAESDDETVRRASGDIDQAAQLLAGLAGVARISPMSDEQGENTAQDVSMPYDHVCPRCGDRYNHYVDNGLRNSWPRGVEFEVCTIEDSEEMFVHVEDLRHSWGLGDADE